jgi:hypothetical protein
MFIKMLHLRNDDTCETKTTFDRKDVDQLRPPAA